MSLLRRHLPHRRPHQPRLLRQPRDAGRPEQLQGLPPTPRGMGHLLERLPLVVRVPDGDNVALPGLGLCAEVGGGDGVEGLGLPLEAPLEPLGLVGAARGDHPHPRLRPLQRRQQRGHVLRARLLHPPRLRRGDDHNDPRGGGEAEGLQGLYRLGLEGGAQLGGDLQGAGEVVAHLSQRRGGVQRVVPVENDQGNGLNVSLHRGDHGLRGGVRGEPTHGMGLLG
mmetsp:Transcript_34209/g.89352  ORF Transcript_34209/g.89352 Transcript_34209/m.89352 type:complete len:224 (+) Transcript_34209:119-790(+)